MLTCCLLSTHSLMVRPAGQMSVPFYGQETRHLSWDNKKKRAGNPLPAPTNVTGCPRRRVHSLWTSLVSVTKHPELKGEYLPIQMHVRQKQEKTKRTVLVHNDTPFQLYKNRFLSTLPLPTLYFCTAPMAFWSTV